jgi:thiol-disulfide isomerase/thioredoxin
MSHLRTKHRGCFQSRLFFVMSIGVLSVNGAPKNPIRADMTLKDLKGQRVRLQDYRGKALVLNFWATWCGPCKAELPMLVEAEKNYSGRGVVFVAASLDDDKTKRLVPEFLNAHNVSFPVWMGATGDDLAKLGMGEAVPATAFIDAEGYIVARVLGQIRAEELKERLEWLVGNHDQSQPEPLVRHLNNN